MRLGPYDIHPGILITVVAVVFTIVFFTGLWIKSAKTTSTLKALAQSEGWTWLGPPPQDLADAMLKVLTRAAREAHKVILVPGSDGPAYLFRLDSKMKFGISGSEQQNASTTRAIGCLVPGKAGPNAPIYSIGQWPPGAARMLVKFKRDLQESLGSPEFRERYYIQSPDFIGLPGEETTELEPVEVPSALEAEMLTWSGTTARGLPDGWSYLVVRDEIVMIVWNNIDDLSAPVWSNLLTKCQKINQILTDR